jgi:hypothetical protein
MGAGSALEIAGSKQQETIEIQHVLDGMDETCQVGEPSGTVKLEDAVASIPIEDDPGQLVALAKNPADSGDRRVQCQRCAMLYGGSHTCAEELGPDGSRYPRNQNPDSDGALGVPEASGQKSPLPIKDDGHIPILADVAGALDGPLKEPGMPCLQGPFCGGVHAHGHLPGRQTGKGGEVQQGR